MWALPLYAKRHRKNPLFSTFNGLTFYAKNEAISRSCNILILKWNKTRDRWQQRLMSREVSWLFSRHAKVSWGIINPRCTGSIAFQLPEWGPEGGGAAWLSGNHATRRTFMTSCRGSCLEILEPVRKHNRRQTTGCHDSRAVPPKQHCKEGNGQTHSLRSWDCFWWAEPSWCVRSSMEWL